MGAGAALIPGIVGIAGGQYLKSQEQKRQAEMEQARIASASRFLGQETPPQVNSMGVRPPIMDRQQLPAGVGGDATRRALEARSSAGMARKFAFEQAMLGNPAPLTAMTNAMMAPEKFDPVTLAEGEMLIDPRTGKQIATNDRAPKEKTPAEQTYAAYLDLYKGDPVAATIAMKRAEALAGRAGEKPETIVPDFKNIYNAKTGELVGTLDVKRPDVVAKLNSGEFRFAETGSKFNNDQNKAAGYAHTLTEAESRIANIKDFNPVSGWQVAMGATNLTASKEYQQYVQAAKDWTLATLRYESGANVPDSEAEKYWTTYFPQFGDSEDVVRQKAASRATKLEGVIMASGGAFNSLSNNTTMRKYNPATGKIE